MAYKYRGGLLRRIAKTNSIKSFTENFILHTKAGQKLFLYNERIPRVINISFIEKTCMYKCVMCSYQADEVREKYRKPSYMDIDTLKRIVETIPNDSYYSFDMSAVGETLEFPQLPDFIAYIKKNRPRCNTVVSTNALLLTDELFLQLSKAGLDNLQLSMFAGNSEDHASITDTKSFERVSENVRSISRLKRNKNIRKPFTQAFILETEENKDKIDGFLREWGNYVDAAIKRPLLDCNSKLWRDRPKTSYCQDDELQSNNEFRRTARGGGNTSIQFYPGRRTLSLHYAVVLHCV